MSFIFSCNLTELGLRTYIICLWKEVLFSFCIAKVSNELRKSIRRIQMKEGFEQSFANTCCEFFLEANFKLAMSLKFAQQTFLARHNRNFSRSCISKLDKIIGSAKLLQRKSLTMMAKAQNFESENICSKWAYSGRRRLWHWFIWQSTYDDEKL